jgi:hypothetical protein
MLVLHNAFCKPYKARREEKRREEKRKVGEVVRDTIFKWVGEKLSGFEGS